MFYFGIPVIASFPSHQFCHREILVRRCSFSRENISSFHLSFEEGTESLWVQSSWVYCPIETKINFTYFIFQPTESIQPIISLGVTDSFLTFNRAFQLSAAQRPKRLSLTVEDSKGEEQEVTVRNVTQFSFIGVVLKFVIEQVIKPAPLREPRNQ